MSGPLPIRNGVYRSSVTTFDPQDAFDGAEIVEEVEITTPPTRGSAVVNVGGLTINYSAPSDFVGDSVLSWRMRILGVWTSPATVTTRVGQLPNRPGADFPRRYLPNVQVTAPILDALADTAETAFRTPITINVLSNDAGSNLRVESIGEIDEEIGTLAITGGGATITFTPTSVFSGEVKFSYTVTNGVFSSRATITLTVLPPAISATADFASTTGRTPVTIPVLANDIGSGLTVIAVANPAQGAATIADGATTVVYTADVGFVGDDTFDYTIQNPGLAQSTGPITVTVNLPAISIVGNNATTVTTTPVVIPVLINDSGVGLEVTSVSDPPSGTAVISGGGTTVTYTADGGFTGTDTFTYVATDDYGQTGVGNVNVVVTSAAATVDAVNDTGTATSGVTKVLSPLANDVGSGLTISALGSPSAGGTAVRINGNTQVQYTPLATFVGNESFTYTATNGSVSDSATVTVTVSALPFTANNDTAITPKNIAASVSPLANDTGIGLVLTKIGATTINASCKVLNDDALPPGNDFYLNPWGRMSAHHRPAGRGVAGKEADLHPEEYYGIPGTTRDWRDRGRMANVSVGLSFNQGIKIFHRVENNDTTCPPTPINPNPQASPIVGLPVTRRMPTAGPYFNSAAFPLNEQKEWNCMFFPKNGEAGSTKMDFFSQFRYTEGVARFYQEFDISGLDYPGDGDDGARGTSASQIRWPSTVLRFHEIASPTSPGPIRHCLHVAATRVGSNLHVLGRQKKTGVAGGIDVFRVWPAQGVDGTANPSNSNFDPNDNLGDIPYGCRWLIPWGNRDARNSTTGSPFTSPYVIPVEYRVSGQAYDGTGHAIYTLNLTARGQALFDCLLRYGFYVLDGSGDGTPTAGNVDFRRDQGTESFGKWDPDIESEVKTQLKRLVPLCLALRNPRPLTTETEIYINPGQPGHNTPFAAGGGPLYPGVLNAAWDA